MSRKILPRAEKTLGGRLLKVRKDKKLNIKQLSEIVGCSSSYLSGIERDNKKPSEHFLDVLEYKIGVNKAWLLTGEGEIKKILAKYENMEHNIDHVADPGHGYYTGVTEKILIMLEKMTEEQRRDVLKYTEEKQLLEELLEERRSKKAG